MPPGRSRVVAKGIVRPFADLMRQSIRVALCSTEESGGVEVRGRIGLDGEEVRSTVIAEEATVAKIGDGRRGEHSVIEHEDGEIAGIHLWLERGKNRVVEVQIKEVNTDDSKRTAGRKSGGRKSDALTCRAAAGWNVEDERGQRVNGIEKEMVVVTLEFVIAIMNHVPEFGALESINVLSVTQIGAADRDVVIIEHRGVLKELKRIVVGSPRGRKLQGMFDYFRGEY